MTNSRVRPPQKPFQFTWQFHTSGYEWIRGKELRRGSALTRGSTLTKKTPQEFLAANFINRTQPRVHRYKPFEDATGLFLNFAKLKLTHKSCKEFAKVYGSLGNSHLFVAGAEDKTRVVLAGDTEEDWYAEIKQMNRLVTLWKALRDHDLHYLGSVIQWRGNSVFGDLQEGRKYSHSIASPENNPEGLELKSGDTIGPAWCYLRTAINDRLVTYPSTAKLWKAEDDSFTLAVVPSNLISAIWLQFAAAVDGDREYRTCRWCGRWFELGRSKRIDAAYCKPSCKQARYRRARKD
jgi:hypothetical protein